MKNRERTGICVLCGEIGPLTDEHIPPRCIFPKPQPSDVRLVTVPACKTCNNGSSFADEEFKVSISMNSGRSLTPSKKLWDSTKRTIRRKTKIRERIKNAVPLFLPSEKLGHYKKFGFVEFEKDTVELVFEKIVAGLYWQHHNEVAPESLKALVVLSNSLTSENREEFHRTIRLVKNQGHTFSIGTNSEFEYAYIGTEDSKSTIWAFEFYQKSQTLVFFSNIEDIQQVGPCNSGKRPPLSPRPQT